MENSNRQILVESHEKFQTFVDAVVDTGIPFLALFSATAWCIPCRRFEPHWLKAQDFLPNHTFVKVDMGESPEDTSQHWATDIFGVRSVPTVKLFGVHGTRDIKARAIVSFLDEVNNG